LEEIEKEVKERLSELDSKLSQKEKRYFHLQSIKNFVFHIFDSKNNIYKSDSRLKLINLKRNKELILDYLKKIENEENPKEKSMELFKNEVKVIGEFMNRNFGFVFAGGKIKYFVFLIWMTCGAFIDFVLMLTSKYSSYYFIIGLLILSISRNVLKSKQKKVYGPNY